MARHGRSIAVKVWIMVSTVCVLLFLTLGLRMACAQSQTEYASIAVSPSQGPWGSTVKATIMIDSQSFDAGGPDGPGSMVSVRIQDAAGNSPEIYMQRARLDALGDYVKTGPFTWSCNLTIPVTAKEGSSIIKLYDWDQASYSDVVIAHTSFTVLPRGSSDTSGGSDAVDLTIPALIAVGGAAVAGGAIVGVRRFTRRRRGRITENRREVGEETGISYEKPPELFVEEWNPPGKYPEKPKKEEVLVKWALLPDNVKQAWRQYEVCRQEALKWLSQIKELSSQYERARRIHISNILKATTKLGFQTAGLIADGVQMLYLEKLRIAAEAARLKNDFKRTALIKSSLADIEKYTQSATQARIAYKQATEAAAGFKDALGVWSRRMEMMGQPGWDGIRGNSSDAFQMINALKRDPSMGHFLSFTNNPNKMFSGKNAMSPEAALTRALKTGLRNALAEMNQWGDKLKNSQTALQAALSQANRVLEWSSGVVDSAIGIVDKVVGKGPQLGGLDIDDPAILSEGQAGLERLQNRMNWLQAHYQMAMDCMNENKGIIDGYSGMQQADQKYNEMLQSGSKDQQTNSDCEMRNE